MPAGDEDSSQAGPWASARTSLDAEPGATYAPVVLGGAPECCGLAWGSGFRCWPTVVPLLSKKAVILLVRPMLAGAKLWAGERGCLCLASIGVVGEFAGLNEVLGDLAEFEVQSLGCAS